MAANSVAVGELVALGETVAEVAVRREVPAMAGPED
jgi:hypothetical protein